MRATSGEPPASTVAEAFVRTLARHAGRVAIRPLTGGPITYAELGGKVRAAVGILQSSGIGAGDRVAVWLPNRPEWAELTYAAAMIGACIVPINVRFRAAELSHALRLSEARLLVTQHRFLTNGLLGRLCEAAGGAIGDADEASIPALPALRKVVLLDEPRVPGTVQYADLGASAAPGADLAALAGGRHPEDPMWFFWTSGTTGAPKGAVLPQAAIAHVWEWTRHAGYRPDDRVLMSRPLFYIAGHFWSLVGPMLHGAACVVGERFTPQEIADLCRREGVTILSGNPLLLRSIVSDSGFDRDAFRSVRLGYFSGSSLPLAEMRRIRDAIGFEQLLQAYGMTELAGFVLSTGRDDPIEVACASCGHPMTEVQLRLVDPETGADVSDGEMGLLMTRGQPFLGYVGLSEADRAQLFDPDGWFRTGDLMRRRSDGTYEFVGRAKDLIKVGGENVAAGEIESVLMSHPRISLAAVVAAADARRGEVPVAFIETRDGPPLAPEELRAWCRELMAPFKVPAAFRIVSSAEWPLTASGKVAKRQLQESLPTDTPD